MEVQPVQKGKRGRKRHSNEEGLTEAERIKKEKNRQAAQKCREKKEKEATDLKKRNAELESENKKLSDEKKNLEKRAQEFHKIIQDHILKGCRLPPNVQEVYNEGQMSISSSGCSEDVELYRAVGTIERDHTPPHTPEELSSGNVSPHIPHGLLGCSGAPTALFSGTPLTEDDITRRRSGSISRSPSSSPAPVSPAKGSHLSGQQKDLSYFLSHDQLPRALAPISPTRMERDEDANPWFSSRLRQTVPTVVSEIEEDSEDTAEYISKSYEIIGKEKDMLMTVPSSNRIETAFQLPDILSEDEVAKQLARQGHITHGNEDKPNLSSLGFSCIPGYSYTEDLQQVESVEEIIDYTNDVQPDNSQPVNIRTENSSLTCTESMRVQPVVNVSVCAPALLGMCEEMSESLQQQIKTSYSAPASSTPGGLSVPSVTQPGTNQNQQSVVTQSGQLLTSANLSTQSSVDAVNLLMSLIRSKSLTVQHGNYVESEIFQVISNQESRLPLRKISVLSPQTGTPIVRQSSEELPVQQGSANQMSAEASVTNILPGCVGVPVIDIKSPHLQTLNPTSQEANIRGSSSYSASGETADPPAPAQHRYVVRESGSRIILLPETFQNTAQAPRQAPRQAPAQAPALIAVANSSALPYEGTDYSRNVQDLPSLNLTELNSENNLFEKKPSRSTS